MRRTAFQLLAYPDMSVERLSAVWPELQRVPAVIAQQLAIEARYAIYVSRQEADIRAFRKDEALLLPSGLDYAQIPSLSIEVREKLIAARPATLGAASRLSGITPAALTALLIHIGTHRAGPDSERRP